MSYHELRRTYTAGELDEGDLPADPLRLFTLWMEHARQASEREPNAMALATVGADGQPRVRYVLLKDASQNGFVFYTNYDSRKGRDLAEVPRASAAFWWPGLERQVRVDGSVEKVAAEESDAYFASRPRGSRLGAWASHQGEVMDDRAALVSAAHRAAERFGESEVPRPPYWGGYALRPHRFEFWQGRPDRLHDRFEYAKAEGGWHIRRLAP